MVAKARASGDVATAEKWQALLEDGSDAATFRDRRGNYLASRPVHDALREKGYDGIVYRNEAEGVDDSYIAFEPQQFKSNKNVGTYDATDPRFLYSRAAPAPSAVPKPSLPEPTDEVRRAHQALAVKRLLSPSAETRAAHQAYQAREHSTTLAAASIVAPVELASGGTLECCGEGEVFTRQLAPGGTLAPLLPLEPAGIDAEMRETEPGQLCTEVEASVELEE